MTPDDVRKLIAFLEGRVALAGTGGRGVSFELPDEPAMLEAGIHPDAVRQVLNAPWLDEMATDVRETGDFCDPGDPPAQVLRYARDVVGEYIRKRFVLPAES